MKKCQKNICVKWSITGISDETKQQLSEFSKMIKNISVSTEDLNAKIHDEKFGMSHEKCEEVLYSHGYVAVEEGVSIEDLMEHLKLTKMQKKKYIFDKNLAEIAYNAWQDSLNETISDKVLPTKIIIDDAEEPEETTEIELAREHSRKETIEWFAQIVDAHIDHHKMAAERAKKDGLYYIQARNEAIANAQIRLAGELHRKLSTKNV